VDISNFLKYKCTVSNLVTVKTVIKFLYVYYIVGPVCDTMNVKISCLEQSSYGHVRVLISKISHDHNVE